MAEPSTLPTVIRIPQEATRADLAEGLANLVAYARRQQCIVGHGETRWDTAHRRIDGLLDEWVTAPE